MPSVTCSCWRWHHHLACLVRSGSTPRRARRSRSVNSTGSVTRASRRSARRQELAYCCGHFLTWRIQACSLQLSRTTQSVLPTPLTKCWAQRWQSCTPRSRALMKSPYTLTSVLWPSTPAFKTKTVVNAWQDFTTRHPSLRLNLRQILVTTCRSLPGCTLAKETCQASDTCRSCWSTLRDRDPSGAVAECISGTGKEELDVMVRQCVSGVDLSCTFWRARCEADPVCRDCFDAMGSGSSPSAMIAGSTDPSCAATRESASSASALLGAFDSCPLTKVNSCMARITGCVLGNARCAECLVTLNGGIPPGGSDDCAELLGVTLTLLAFARKLKCSMQ
eukprot:m.208489 g.208489  ORF g.208489 m.208489 type:complete len:335 (-) comp15455_c0_seq1:4877-5881(-)